MFDRFKRRSHELERLDTGDYTPDEYRRWLREMELIHGVFGEAKALKRSLYRDIRSESNGAVPILDVGPGSGGLLRQIGRWVRDKKTFLAGLEIEPRAARAMESAGVVSIQGNALELPFRDGSFDYVFCTLFLHHLDDISAIRLLREMARVA